MCASSSCSCPTGFYSSSGASTVALNETCVGIKKLALILCDIFFYFKTWMSARIQRFQIFVIPIQPVPLPVTGTSVPVQHQKLEAMLTQITAVMVSIFQRKKRLLSVVTYFVFTGFIRGCFFCLFCYCNKQSYPF